ncbi:response regulator transcription factor [Cellulomonas sp. P24]|uniref:response regulator n=1 Tax=Cellulomonas sp. P24 TaxID=2885206 RepID=UPI00216B3024|nr:response regulator transcription factor [Cellulomonas sp. P24]MCR6494405.1 response regulator transcription factor [Cellulomonas sp. P24]
MSDGGRSALRLVLVDDHEMVLHGLTAMLAHFDRDVAIVGTATTLADARRAIDATLPDIVVSDVRIGRDSGLDLVRELAQTHPAIKVVVLTVYDDEHYLFQALRAGARGYVLKRIDAAELVAHLLRVAEGEIAIDAALAGRVAMSAARISSGEFWPGANHGLTQRESEVLALLVSGHSNRAIAATLVVTEDTVKTHIRSLYRKLDVQDRGGAIAFALREGLFR